MRRWLLCPFGVSHEEVAIVHFQVGVNHEEVAFVSIRSMS